MLLQHWYHSRVPGAVFTTVSLALSLQLCPQRCLYSSFPQRCLYSCVPVLSVTAVSLALSVTMSHFRSSAVAGCAVCASQKVKLTGWMLVMCKLAEVQLESTVTAADELEEQREKVEKLTQVVEKLKQKNTKLSDTISQQQSVINGIQGLLQHSGTAPTE